MPHLNTEDLKPLSSFLADLYAQTDFGKLPLTILEGLSRLIPCEHYGYNEINSKTNEMLVVMHPFVPEVFQLATALEANIAQHPQLQHYRINKHRGALQTTDFVSRREFREMGIYKEFYQYVDTENQMAILLSEWGADCDIGIGINRKQKDFSERDREMLQLLRPHLIQARENAIKFTEARRAKQALTDAIDSMNSGVIALDEAGRIVWFTPGAARLLEIYFPEKIRSFTRLPELLDRWVKARCAQMVSGDSLAQALRPFAIQLESSRLTVRIKIENPHCRMLLLNEECIALSQETARAMGLTKREAEVLHWMIEGKSNPEIALILQISVRTIHKHVEHILAKLCVETRQAATRKALLFH